MYQKAGHCPKCGASYYVPSMWNGIIPPTPTPSCGCWNTVKTYTTTNSCVFDGTQHSPLSEAVIWFSRNTSPEATSQTVVRNVLKRKFYER
jgi:hypothetical protein